MSALTLALSNPRPAGIWSMTRAPLEKSVRATRSWAAAKPSTNARAASRLLPVLVLALLGGCVRETARVPPAWESHAHDVAARENWDLQGKIGVRATKDSGSAMLSWRQREQPLWQTRAPLVVALDLSSAILANDLPPSRLLQARAKIAELLKERAGGQVGLVAYADEAYTVAPLTDDAANVALFLDALSPDVVPVANVPFITTFVPGRMLKLVVPLVSSTTVTVCECPVVGLRNSSVAFSVGVPVNTTFLLRSTVSVLVPTVSAVGARAFTSRPL